MTQENIDIVEIEFNTGKTVTIYVALGESIVEAVEALEKVSGLKSVDHTVHPWFAPPDDPETVDLTPEAEAMLDTLRKRLDQDDAEIVADALSLYEIQTRPPVDLLATRPRLERVTDPTILARLTAQQIVVDLLEWEAEQGGYEAECWEEIRDIRGFPQRFSLPTIYDAMVAVQEWGDLLGGWEAPAWDRLADFVDRFAEHVDRMRTIMEWCRPQAT